MELAPNGDGLRIARPALVTEDGYRLGAWQDVQRQAYKKGTLSKKRVARLEAAGIVWEMRPHDDEERQQEKQPLRELLGGRCAPRRDGGSLGREIAHQAESHIHMPDFFPRMSRAGCFFGFFSCVSAQLLPPMPSSVCSPLTPPYPPPPNPALTPF